MTNLHHFLIKPFTAKGLLWGTVDLFVKLVALTVWVYLTYILGALVYKTFVWDYNHMTQLWWCAYCFILFFGASVLAYILVFVRDYNQPDAE